MKLRIRRLAELVRTEFWITPFLMVIGGLILAGLTLEIDLGPLANFRQSVFWLFEGQPDAARSLLSVIAGSLITVISISFSITIIAIQQAASQYSPRIIEHFRRDRVSHLVLGTYLATFAFSLIILQVVRSPTTPGAKDDFVPALSVNMAVLLALVSIVLLAYFIHHIIQMIQVSSILVLIRARLSNEIDKLRLLGPERPSRESRNYHEEVAQVPLDWPGLSQRVILEHERYFKSLDIARLSSVARSKGLQHLWITRAIGEFLIAGATVAEIWAPRVLTEGETKELLSCLEFGIERTVHQDALFGVRQITDIAIKALSPGVNDPTTAEQCICELKGALAHVMATPIAPPRTEIHGIFFLINRPDFETFAGKAFDQIIRNSRTTFDVVLFMVNAIIDLLAISKHPSNSKALKTRLSKIASQLSATTYIETEKAHIRDRVESAISDDRLAAAGKNVAGAEQAV